MKSLLHCSQCMMIIMMWKERLCRKMLSHIKILYFDTCVLFLDTCFTEVHLSTCTSSCWYIHLWYAAKFSYFCQSLNWYFSHWWVCVHNLPLLHVLYVQTCRMEGLCRNAFFMSGSNVRKLMQQKISHL